VQRSGELEASGWGPFRSLLQDLGEKHLVHANLTGPPTCQISTSTPLSHKEVSYAILCGCQHGVSVDFQPQVNHHLYGEVKPALGKQEEKMKPCSGRGGGVVGRQGPGLDQSYIAEKLWSGKGTV
jgi:hypothetical protein